jgi:hypothetical protein
MASKKIILQQEFSVSIKGFEQVGDIRYNNELKYAYAKVNLITDSNEKFDYPEVLLWEGFTYDAIGQWQDSDVTKRLNEIFGL